MKFIVIVTILATCLTPISASFFDEFRGAVVSVHQSFEKLFSDVVTDVTDTIGCTLLAVKQVLTLEEAYHESSEYDRKCRGRSSSTNDKPENAFIDTNERNAQEEITKIKLQLEKQTNRLVAISNLLKSEIESIPNNIRIRFKTPDPDPNESTVESIWRDLKLLHSIEHSDESIPQIDEIHKVLNEALDMMQINDTHPNISDDQKIKEIVESLEKESNDTIIGVEDQFSKWEKEEDTKEKMETNTLEEVKENFSKFKIGENTKDRLNTVNEVETEIRHWKNEEDNKAKEVVDTLNEVEQSFSKWDREQDTKERDATKSASKNEVQQNELLSNTKNDIYNSYHQDQSIQNNEPVKAVAEPSSLSATSSQTISTDTKTDSDFEQFQEQILSQFSPKDDKEKDEAVKEAEKIIKDSQYRNKIFNYLKSAEDSGSDVFEHPELFNFGS